jgi:hypothetical protein
MLKRSYPTPRIDQIVDSTSGCELLSFIDAYSGFHQVQMAREDEEKTIFVTPDGLYCYTSMPYELKNALSSFVRATQKTFKDDIYGIIKVYVDDIVAKSMQQTSPLQNLAQVFDGLRSTCKMLNPEKCVFGVSAGKLFDFFVSYPGIEANPEKIRAVKNMRPPVRVKNVRSSRDASRHLFDLSLNWVSAPSCFKAASQVRIVCEDPRGARSF